MSGLLGLRGMDRDEITGLLDLADEFVDAEGRLATPSRYRTALDGESVGLLFFEPSTRTRASFELAVHRLGGYPMIFDSTSSSIRKGEGEIDTCRNLEAMGVKAFVIRHAERQFPFAVSDRLKVPVLNAGNGSGEHPTQGLIDLLTLRRHFGRLEGLRVAFIGDIIHSRVARSGAYGLRALGAEVVLAGPPPMLPAHRDDWDVEFADSRAAALDGADAVIMLRIQRERAHGETMSTQEYVRDWGLDDEVLDADAKKDIVVMHPGPVMRGVEMASTVLDGPKSLVLRQAGLGVAVRQAVLMKYVAGE